MAVKLADLMANEDQCQILDAVEAYLRAELPIERLRDQKPSSCQEHLRWSSLAEIGIFGLAIPEEFGGIGLGATDEALLFRLLGRYLLGPSILASTLAAKIAIQAGDADLVDRIVGGRARIAMGKSGEGNTALVMEPDGADYCLIIGDRELSLLDMRDAGAMTMLEGFDETIGVAQVELPAVGLSARRGGSDSYADLVLLASAYMAGVAEAARDMAVEHAKTREQFGKPIGSFQAIKHHCANMATQAHAAASLNLFAAATAREKGSDTGYLLAASQLISSRSAIFCSSLNIQIHGAMGFTAECLAHFCLKRSHLMNRLSGGGTENAEQLLLARLSPTEI